MRGVRGGEKKEEIMKKEKIEEVSKKNRKWSLHKT